MCTEQGYIATLLSRLEANEGTFWSLLVKINDGTAALDVVISDQVCLISRKAEYYQIQQ